MHFYSTAGQVRGISLREAIFQGFAPDGGMYLPEGLPQFSQEKIRSGKGLSFTELSIELSKDLFEGVLSHDEVKNLCQEVFNFPVPFLTFPNQMGLLELFHGPSLSFKDFGARLLSGLIKLWHPTDREVTVLVATSGDTGSAIGLAMKGIPGVRVMILYPKGRVTPSQEQQLTSIGRNVQAIQVDGTFEECQNLLKEAVLDAELQNAGIVTTGNSINIARILAQSLYYFYAYSQFSEKNEEVIFSVPCGNFGHLVSGILAKKMGLPIHRLIAVTNINNEVPLFLRSGVFEPHASYPTISVSMDVGNPSNFPRLLELYGHSLEKMRHEIIGVDFTDDQIKQAIQEMYADYGYILDPHTANAYLGLREYLRLENHDFKGIFFATAHPSKFLESLSPLLKTEIHVPERLQMVMRKEKHFITIPASYAAFKELFYSQVKT